MIAPFCVGRTVRVSGERERGQVTIGDYWFDRGDGSLALAIGHANGAILRAARVGAEDAEIWSDSVGRVIAETALSVGHTPTFTETLVATVSGRILSADRNAALVVPRQTVGILRGRIGGTPSSRRSPACA